MESPLWEPLKLDIQRFGGICLLNTVTLILVGINILGVPLVEGSYWMGYLPGEIALVVQSIIRQQLINTGIGSAVVGIVMLTAGEYIFSQLKANREIWLMAYIGKILGIISIIGSTIGVLMHGLTFATIYIAPLFLVYLVLMATAPFASWSGYRLIAHLEMLCRPSLPENDPSASSPSDGLIFIRLI